MVTMEYKIKMKLKSPNGIEEIKNILVKKYGSKTEAYWEDQLVKSFFDKMKWKEVI